MHNILPPYHLPETATLSARVEVDAVLADIVGDPARAEQVPLASPEGRLARGAAIIAAQWEMAATLPGADKHMPSQIAPAIEVAECLRTDEPGMRVAALLTAAALLDMTRRAPTRGPSVMRRVVVDAFAEVAAQAQPLAATQPNNVLRQMVEARHREAYGTSRADNEAFQIMTLATALHTIACRKDMLQQSAALATAIARGLTAWYANTSEAARPNLPQPVRVLAQRMQRALTAPTHLSPDIIQEATDTLSNDPKAVMQRLQAALVNDRVVGVLEEYADATWQRIPAQQAAPAEHKDTASPPAAEASPAYNRKQMTQYQRDVSERYYKGLTGDPDILHRKLRRNEGTLSEMLDTAFTLEERGHAMRETDSIPAAADHHIEQAEKWLTKHQIAVDTALLPEAGRIAQGIVSVGTAYFIQRYSQHQKLKDALRDAAYRYYNSRDTHEPGLLGECVQAAYMAGFIYELGAAGVAECNDGPQGIIGRRPLHRHPIMAEVLRQRLLAFYEVYHHKALQGPRAALALQVVLRHTGQRIIPRAQQYANKATRQQRTDTLARVFGIAHYT